MWNIKQYFVHWYCESLHQITGSTDIMSESGQKTSTVSPDQGTTGDPATPKREGTAEKSCEGTAEKTNQTPRRKIFYRAEELSRLLKTLNKKDWAWSGIVHSDPGIITSGDIYIGSKRSKSDYLSVFWTVCCLANNVYNWFNWRKVQMVRWACWYPLILTTSVKWEKLPAMYNCVKCMYICVIVGFVLLVSDGFKTLGWCLLKGGKYVTGATLFAFHFAVLLWTQRLVIVTSV